MNDIKILPIERALVISLMIEQYINKYVDIKLQVLTFLLSSRHKASNAKHFLYN